MMYRRSVIPAPTITFSDLFAQPFSHIEQPESASANLTVCLTIAFLCTQASAQTLAAGHAEQVDQAQIMQRSADLPSEWHQRAAAGLTPAVITDPSLTAAAILMPSIDVTKAPGAPEISLSLRSGTVAFEQLQPTAATGTYTLGFFAICDAAGNCLSASTPADNAKDFSKTTLSVMP